MTLRYLVDTDWIIDYLSGHELAIRRLDDLKESGLAISIVSLAELFEGIYYSSNPQGNERYSTPPTFNRT
jgi:tRNA(fMet)-specific endonuclease VapC